MDKRKLAPTEAGASSREKLSIKPMAEKLSSLTSIH